MIRIFAVVAAVGIGAGLSDQDPQGRGRATGPRAAAANKVASVRVTVRSEGGDSVEGARVRLTSGATGDFTTGPAGTVIVPDLKPGTHRLRIERDGYLTLEREFTLGSGAWNPIEVVLSPAPPPPPPPKPVAAPAPPPTAMAPSGPPVVASLPDFLDRNFIARDPIKESILACKPLETVRVLQMREPIAPHVHDRIDEIIYVVAGEGAVHIGDEVTAIRAGSLAVVPRGSQHSFERRAKNPLILLSILTGSPCEATKTAP